MFKEYEFIISSLYTYAIGFWIYNNLMMLGAYSHPRWEGELEDKVYEETTWIRVNGRGMLLWNHKKVSKPKIKWSLKQKRKKKANKIL